MDMSDIDVKGDATFYCEVCYPKPSIKDSKHWHNLIAKMHSITAVYGTLPE
tara:strand:- start:315 stop:467 length:153 start_codon:yes stop_codon:yes gene_type:complete